MSDELIRWHHPTKIPTEGSVVWVVTPYSILKVCWSDGKWDDLVGKPIALGSILKWAYQPTGNRDIAEVPWKKANP